MISHGHIVHLEIIYRMFLGKNFMRHIFHSTSANSKVEFELNQAQTQPGYGLNEPELQQARKIIARAWFG